LGGHDAHYDQSIILATGILIVLGAGAAFIRFRNPETALAKWQAGKNPVKTILERKLFIDDAYDFLVKKVGLKIAHWLNRFDRWFVNDVMVNGTSFRVLDLGKIAARIQNGQLQDYLFIAVIVGVAVLFVLT
jgi:NADH:ubiquinone oxidoreductase subunit 5 (subunit L)/multisubunit Na+/H+ antiporter MnhA subunit